jgi:flagellar hook-associated protein 1 FlgK
MPGIEHVMNIAKWAIQAQQMGIAVTSHNVANVNTPGYSRQRLQLATARPFSNWPPQFQTPGQLGSGVQAVAIERIYDRFLGVELRGELSEKGSLSAQEKAFERLESVFTSVSETDLGSDLNVFWGAWEDLSTHPEGAAERVAVREAGVNLAGKVQEHMEGLIALQEEMDRSVQLNVDKINELVTGISELNVEIARVEYRGENANDLRDMRDLRLDELAGLINIQTWENEYGIVTVQAPGGKPLVMENQTWTLATQETNPRQSDVFWVDLKGNMTPITDDIRSGSLDGLISMRDQYIPQEMNRMNEIAREVIWAVNVEHAASVGLSTQSTMSSQVAVAAGVSLNDAVDGPPFADRVQAGELHIWIYDNAEPPVPQNQMVVNVDPAWTLEDLANDIQAQSGGMLVATVNGDRTLTIQGVGVARFAVSQDESHALSAIGLNTFFKGSDAQDMGVDDAILGDVNLVGAGRVDDDGSLTGTPGGLFSGDNRGALAVASLRDTPLVGSSTAEGAFAALVAEVGVEASRAYNNSEYQNAVVQQLEDHMSATSGVNLDEEMINLMKYQSAYEAASKLIVTAQEMLQAILDLV